MNTDDKKYKVYTRGGDKGKTSLIGGKRVFKNDAKVEAYGTMDELKSYVGLLHSEVNESFDKDYLKAIMIDLFVAESIVASHNEETAAQMPQLDVRVVEQMEEKIDAMDKELPTLEAFILPSGHPLVAQCHIARTLCRRAERRCIDLVDENPYISPVIQYLNRLSDYLFIYARWICQKLGKDEVKWNP